jgi:hypothetical protein
VVSEEKKVTILQKTTPNGTKNFPKEVSISRAIAEVEAGVSTYHGSLDDLKEAHRRYILGDLEIHDRLSRLEDHLSFFVNIKPKIEMLVNIIQTANRFWSTNWGIIITLISLVSGVLGIWAGWPLIMSLLH